MITVDEDDLRQKIHSAMREAVLAERERCAQIAESQPPFPGTTPKERRQQWVKEEIARKIREPQ